ncbi:MAG TPA: hypothetical protein VMD91_11510 [Candidatus Sulfotelmatobacter sp.]|nr:hypothetical protein [Candidatus Sulfotelmatobacter sp.]
MRTKPTVAAVKAAQAALKAKNDEAAQRAAEVESDRVRAMFAEDRKRFERRYGVLSITRAE